MSAVAGVSALNALNTLGSGITETVGVPAASSSLLGFLGPVGGIAGTAAGLLGMFGGSDMLGGGGYDQSSASNYTTLYTGPFSAGSDKTMNWVLVGVVVLLIILLAKGK